MKRILVIDDDDQVRETISELLKVVGYVVEDAPNGAVGSRLYRDNPFDLVITDIFMPDKEGLETILELRRDFPSVKIIAMSGGGTDGILGYLPAAEKFGAVRTFIKPFELRELLTTVEELIGTV
jgi:DNA-binding response OmpR family regulator